MTVTSLEGKQPAIAEGCWVHPSSEAFGDVDLGTHRWIGPGARLRGDFRRIVLGECCAVEDDCVVYGRPGETRAVGAWATLGYGCVVHSVAAIGDFAIVGMNTVVSDWADVPERSVIAEDAVVPQRAVVPAARIAAGVSTRVLDLAVDDEYRAAWRGFKQRYVDLCERYHEGFDR